MAKEKIKDTIENILKDFLKEESYQLYNVEFVKEGKDWFLRVYIDKTFEQGSEAQYVGIEDCEKVARFLGEKLDQADPIKQNYFLEVSSPGMDRELVTLEHFKRYEKQMIDIKLYRAINNHKNIQCKLISADEKEIVVKYEEEILAIPMEQVAKTRLSVIF